MRIRAQSDLLLIDIVTVLLIVVITFSPDNVLRIAFGLLLVLFFPGYTLVAALFPGKSQLVGIERLALSFVLSMAIVALIGFILNYTPWGVRLYPVLIAITIFILATSLITWYRRHRLVEAERFGFYLNWSMATWRGKGLADKVLSLILVLVILGAIGTISYAITAPKVGERFTEFYILGPRGNVEDYPRELVLGEEASVIIGIINREHEDVSYRVVVTIDGIRHNEIGPVLLNPGRKREGQIGFTPTRLGDNQKVEFLLYKNGQGEPCLKPLHLWVDVK